MGMIEPRPLKMRRLPVTSRVRVSIKKNKKKSRNDDNTDTVIRISTEYQSTE